MTFEQHQRKKHWNRQKRRNAAKHKANCVLSAQRQRERNRHSYPLLPCVRQTARGGVR